MHVVVAGAPLSAPAGMVDGPRGAGHPVAVVAGVGGVVAPVGVVAVVVVAGEEQGRRIHQRKNQKWTHWFYILYYFSSVLIRIE